MGGGAYSRLIRLAQIVLPLAALSLLAVLFLIARAPSGEAEIPYADVEAIAREQRLTLPTFSGVTGGGEVVTASARLARPEGDGGARVTTLTATIRSPSGVVVEIDAGEASLDAGSGIARATGLARVRSSTGYRMETRGLVTDLETGRVTSQGAVEIRAPFGRVTAQAMAVEPATDSMGQRLVFSGGVHLLYQPQAQ